MTHPDSPHNRDCLSSSGGQSLFDWAALHARLEALRRAVEGDTRSPDEIAAILRDRAAALARPPAPAATDASLALLVFAAAGERYAAASADVLGVVPLRGFTPVPCTPAFVRGVINFRGRVVPVLDPGRLLARAPAGNSPPGRAVVLRAGETLFALAASAVEGLVSLPASALAQPPLAAGGTPLAFIRGVTPDGAGVLDLDAMARDPRLIVQEEVTS